MSLSPKVELCKIVLEFAFLARILEISVVSIFKRALFLKDEIMGRISVITDVRMLPSAYPVHIFCAPDSTELVDNRSVIFVNNSKYLVVHEKNNNKNLFNWTSLGAGQIAVLSLGSVAINPFVASVSQPLGEPFGAVKTNTAYNITHFNKYIYPCSNLQNISESSSGSTNIPGKLRPDIIPIILLNVTLGVGCVTLGGDSACNQLSPNALRSVILPRSIKSRRSLNTLSRVKSSITFEGIWGKITPESIDVFISVIVRFARFTKKPKKTVLKSIFQLKALVRAG